MKKILLIQTGGTIAMDISQGEPQLKPEVWAETIHRHIPELSEIADIKVEMAFFEDSSDVNRSHWQFLIRFLAERYEQYDGFVILHGTDTMAYTASALSFGLQHLDKPVILTGSQVPLSNIRSDARRNLVNAIEMATLPLPEVAICFNDFVFRGNRSTKTSIGDFDAFASPNFPPLAEIGLNIKLHRKPSDPARPLAVNTKFSDELFLLKLFPNLCPAFLDSMDLGPLRAVIIEAFGSGNFPMNGDYNLVYFLQKCIDKDIVLAITSQATYDSVDLNKYQSGRRALKMGAVSAGDMTTEAALTKMMYLLGNYSSREEIAGQFTTNIAGELTE